MVFDPGLTVVVGPNGSGKSNVSDAILWVLGEQSAHMLRGQAMEDVIFSGSSARSAVGLAEVTLVLDNSDHTLPVDFSEVAITRRMYRSGESEYLINNSNARLMDIQDILHDSGLGKDTHSIISQGKLDSILSSRPEQRRVLIEEAAGISKHQRRRERSLRRLKRMDENLVRAKDIQKMIARQLRPLERQMRSAQEGRELKSQLELLETRLLVDQLRDLQLAWGQCQQQLEQSEGQLSQARGQLDSGQRQLREATAQLQRREKASQDLSSRRERFHNVTTRLESILRIAAEKESHLDEKLAEIRQNQENYHQFQQDLAASKADLEEDLARLALAEADALEQVRKLTPEVEELQRRYDEASRNLTLKRNRLADSRRSLDADTLESSQASQGRDQAEATLSRLQAELDTLASSRQDTEIQRRDFLAQAERLDRELRELKDAERHKRQELQQASDRLARAHSELQAANKDLTHAQARLEGLKSADRQIDDGNPLAQVLAEAGHGHIQAHLADLIQVPTGLEAVFENLLGARLAALLVDSGEDLTALSHLAARSGAAGQAFLYALDPLKDPGSCRPGHLEGKPAFTQAERQVILDLAPDACFLIDQVVSDKAHEALVRRLFARSLLVGDVDQALTIQAQVGSCTCITEAGELVEGDGCLILGQADSVQSGVLERKRQIRELEAGMSALESQVEAAQRRKDKASAELDQLKQEVNALSARLATTKSDLASRSMEDQRCQRDLERLDRAERQLKAQMEAAEIQRDQAENQLQDLRVRIEEKTKDLETLAQEVGQLETLPLRIQESQQEKSRQLTASQLELTKSQERLDHVRQRLEDLDAREAQQARKLQAWQAAESKVTYQKLCLKPVQESFGQLEHDAMACRRQLEAEAHAAKEACNQAQRAVSDLRHRSGAVRNRISQLESQVNDGKVSLGRLEVQVNNSIQAIRDSSPCGLEGALQLDPVEDREAAGLQVARYRERLRALGPINEIAVEQYQELKARSDYISAQVDDLIAARKSLVKINGAIERKMRRQFLDTFKTVDENFQEVFAILFPGGSARLELLDPDHPEESGLEIVAQPKGKRITKMMLLSGGEKSLTALALLFAVYKTRTVPFYVFDEVEAALDASNLDKLLYAIEQLKKTTQLIVISHQRRTMEQADVLYGIAMHADGVSHVVSQRLDKTIGKVVDA